MRIRISVVLTDVQRMVVDCAGIKRAESKGFAVLQQVAQIFAAQGGRVLLRNVPEQVRKALKESDLDRELSTTQDVASALKMFGEPLKSSANDVQPGPAK